MIVIFITEVSSRIGRSYICPLRRSSLGVLRRLKFSKGMQVSKVLCTRGRIVLILISLGGMQLASKAHLNPKLGIKFQRREPTQCTELDTMLLQLLANAKVSTFRALNFPSCLKITMKARCSLDLEHPCRKTIRSTIRLILSFEIYPSKVQMQCHQVLRSRPIGEVKLKI